MGVFHVFQIIQMAPNHTKHLIYFLLFLSLLPSILSLILRDYCIGEKFPPKIIFNQSKFPWKLVQQKKVSRLLRLGINSSVRPVMFLNSEKYKKKCQKSNKKSQFQTLISVILDIKFYIFQNRAALMRYSNNICASFGKIDSWKNSQSRCLRN